MLRHTVLARHAPQQNVVGDSKNMKHVNIRHQISDKIGHIQFWCEMTPDRSHSNTVRRVANKVRVEGGFRLLCAIRFRKI